MILYSASVVPSFRRLVCRSSFSATHRQLFLSCLPFCDFFSLRPYVVQRMYFVLRTANRTSYTIYVSAPAGQLNRGWPILRTRTVYQVWSAYGVQLTSSPTDSRRRKCSKTAQTTDRSTIIYCGFNLIVSGKRWPTLRMQHNGCLLLFPLQPDSQ